MTLEEGNEAYETAMELLEFADMIGASGETDRFKEAEEAYQRAVAIKDKFP